MQKRVDIGFEQLVRLVKQLPSTQWARLKEEVDKKNRPADKISDLEAFLLTAPVFTKEQLDEIANTRNTITKWRTS
jgi:hypothetical protein